MIRQLIAAALLGAIASSAAAFPKLPAAATTKPLPAGYSDYKGVDQAVAAKVEPGSAESTAGIGHLGLAVERRFVGPYRGRRRRARLAGAQSRDPEGRHRYESRRSADHDARVVPRVGSGGAPGKPLKIEVMRDGKTIEAVAVLKAFNKPLKVPTGPRPYLGLEVEEIKEGDGVKVKSVAADSPAAKAKLDVGDQVLKIEGEDVTRPNKIQDILSYKRPGDNLTFIILSGKEKKEKELIVTLATPEPGKGGFGPRGGGRGGAGGNFAAPPALWKSPAMRLAVIGIDFADTKHNAKVTPEELQKLFFSRGSFKQSATGQAANGSLRDYLHEVSAGKLKLDDGKVFPWVEVAKKRGDYVQGTGTSNRTAPLTDALSKLTAGDNKDALKDFDAIVFVYAGNRFAQNRGAVFAPHAGTIQAQGRRLPYMLVPEGGSTLTNLGGLAKEACLMLGLPDLTVRRENARRGRPWPLVRDVGARY